MQVTGFDRLCTLMLAATAVATLGGAAAFASGSSAWSQSSSDSNVEVLYRTRNPIYQGDAGDELRFRVVNHNGEPVEVRFQATYAFSRAQGSQSGQYEQSVCVRGNAEREAGASPYDSGGHDYSDVDTTIMSVRPHEGPCY